MSSRTLADLLVLEVSAHVTFVLFAVLEVPFAQVSQGTEVLWRYSERTGLLVSSISGIFAELLQGLATLFCEGERRQRVLDAFCCCSC